MKEFATPLAARRKRAERYWTDPDYRLRQLNWNRARNGRPLLSSVDEIGEHLKAHARSRARGERGRFL